MAKLSLSHAWDDTRATMRRDGRLIVAVALAMLVLPGVLSDVVAPARSSSQVPTLGWWTGLTVAALLIGVAGQLAIVRLALGPPSSVGEAIRHGIRRLPVYLGATVMWMLPLALATFLLLSLSPDPAKPSAGTAFGLALLFPIFLFVAVRLLLSIAVASAEPVSPPTVVRRSWALSQGQFLRLFAFLALFLIVYLILVLAVSAVIGTAVRVSLGEVKPFTVAALLASLATQVVGALVTTTLMVMLAKLYAQVAGQTPQVQAIAEP